MLDYQERVVAERDALQELNEKLGSFILSDTFNRLPLEDGKDLVEQRMAMNLYLHILERRIRKFSK